MLSRGDVVTVVQEEMRRAPQSLLIRQLQERLRWGSGSPENAVAAPVGVLYVDEDGGAGTTLYVKESGTGDTGWVAK